MMRGRLFAAGLFAVAAVFACGCRQSKTSEARANVKRMYDSAREHYMQHGAFIAASTPVTPATPTACCETCAPDASLWTSPTWVALGFSMKQPHYYAYQYAYDPDVGVAGVFTVRAYGDLDCDGYWSTFEMSGSVNPAVRAE